MAQISVPEAAERLGVSEARVRQRIEAGDLCAEKIGGRWLVHLHPEDLIAPNRGRRSDPRSIWSALVDYADAPLDDSNQAANDALFRCIENVSQPSRWRAKDRLRNSLAHSDFDALLAWLRNRASRCVYIAAPSDIAALLNDPRLIPSGVAHRDSHMRVAGIAEGYVAEGDDLSLINDYWLETPEPAERPNVILHVAPARPPRINALLLAADLAEHNGPRERERAQNLLAWVAAGAHNNSNEYP